MQFGKKVILSLVTAFSMVSAGQAMAATDTGTINLSVDYTPTISLSGDVFATPTQPTAGQLSANSQVLLGNMAITGNSTNCAVTVSTANGFALANGANTLSQYAIEARTTGGGGYVGKWNWTNNAADIGPCANYKLLYIKRDNGTFNGTAPAITYTDTVTVTVANQ